MPKEILVKPEAGQEVVVNPVGGLKIAKINRSKTRLQARVTVEGVYVEPEPPPVEPPPVEPPPVEPPPDPTPTDVVFSATGSGNQGAAFASFVKANRGKRIAVEGIMKVAGTVTQPAIRLDDSGPLTTITFRPGARIDCTAPSWGILVFWNGFDYVVKNAEVSGIDQYGWDGPGGEDPNGVQDGIAIYGGGRITLTKPYVHDNRGDGIFVGNNGDQFPNPAAVWASDVRLERNARNGVTCNAGQLVVDGGIIDRSGLHSVDVEPNTAKQGASVDLLVKNLRLTKHWNLRPGTTAGTGHSSGTGYAFGAAWGGGASAMKRYVGFENVTADDLSFVLANAQTAYVVKCASDRPINGGAGPFEAVNVSDWTLSGSPTMTNPVR